MFLKNLIDLQKFSVNIINVSRKYLFIYSSAWNIRYGESSFNSVNSCLCSHKRKLKQRDGDVWGELPAPSCRMLQGAIAVLSLPAAPRLCIYLRPFPSSLRTELFLNCYFLIVNMLNCLSHGYLVHLQADRMNTLGGRSSREGTLSGSRLVVVCFLPIAVHIRTAVRLKLSLFSVTNMTDTKPTFRNVPGKLCCLPSSA